MTIIHILYVGVYLLFIYYGDINRVLVVKHSIYVKLKEI